MAKEIRNMGASVRRRLLLKSRQDRQPFDLLLTRYALERLLYRLTQTKHQKNFVLKGAMLLAIWFDDPTRPTRDIDLLGFGSSDVDEALDIFREVCAVKLDDGVEFDVDGLEVTTNREDLKYGGLRIQTYARVDNAKIRIIIDIGFGDAIEPGLEELELPVLLDQPRPRIRAYARETVVAEKFQAMVMIGQANTRLKDYYDLWVLAKSYEFDTDRLARAVAATFKRRDTPVPIELPAGLKPEFFDDTAKIKQWTAFLGEVANDPGSLEDVVGVLTPFLMAAAKDAAALSSADADPVSAA